MRRLFLNRGCYGGETIEIQSVLRDIAAHAARHGWTLGDIPISADERILALTRFARQGGRNIYLSAGIHGDEPAGPLALARLLEEDRWPEETNFWICPCLNPEAFARNRRENRHGVDLNRDYRHLLTAEVRAHATWLRAEPEFNLALCLHEDWEAAGFYLYEVNAGGLESRAAAIIQAVEKVCPIDGSELIENRPAQGGIIRPNINPESRPDWPEALFLIQLKTRLCYTFEAPSDFPLAGRVNALRAAVQTAIGGRL